MNCQIESGFVTSRELSFGSKPAKGGVGIAYAPSDASWSAHSERDSGHGRAIVPSSQPSCFNHCATEKIGLNRPDEGPDRNANKTLIESPSCGTCYRLAPATSRHLLVQPTHAGTMSTVSL